MITILVYASNNPRIRAGVKTVFFILTRRFLFTLIATKRSRRVRVFVVAAIETDCKINLLLWNAASKLSVNTLMIAEISAKDAVLQEVLR